MASQKPAVNLFKSVFSIGLVCTLAGCHLRPDLGPPGTIYEQRAKAVLGDPFPNNELGPPIMGGRPRGFEQPLSQPTNIQASPYSDINKRNVGPFQRLFGRR